MSFAYAQDVIVRFGNFLFSKAVLYYGCQVDGYGYGGLAFSSIKTNNMLMHIGATLCTSNMHAVQ